jgi:uncharacterized protein YndB with AHSA1/START domain
MSRLQVTDRRDIAAAAERIFALLSDAESYPRWWPPALNVRAVDGDVEIRPAGASFRCRMVEADPPWRIVVDYIEGMQRGFGVWTLEPSADGQGTSVAYAVDLVPHGMIAQMLFKTMDVAGIHSRHMQEVLAGLAREAEGGAF